MKSPEIEKMINEIKDSFERDVANLLLDLGLDIIDANVKVGKVQHELLGEIDSLFRIKDYLFLVEASKEKTSNEKKFSFFTKWQDKDILRLITEPYNLDVKIIFRIFFDQSTPQPQNKSPYLLALTKPGKYNKVVYRNDYELFLEHVGKSDSIDFFLKWIES